MLSSSLRRAAWAPIVPISGISRASGQALAASSTNIIRTTQHARQRRYSSSSSKPSDGSRRVDASSQTPTKGVNSGEKREGKPSRRRGKDGNGRGGSKSSPPTAFSRLPSVPSTQHLQPHDVHVASFFSIHRPISVSTTVPPPSSSEAFDSIFTSKKSSKDDSEDVIFTLSSAVHTMENAAHRLAETDNSMNVFEVEGNHFDGFDMSDLKVSVEELTKRLRPFNPPPPPVPFDESREAGAAESENLDSQQTASYSTVLTIHESTHADGHKTYEARTMEAPGADEAEAIIDIPQNSQTSYVERVRNNGSMHAISTRRRRKLKMKKHKFKKLLRRTRTLRRKLDKA
ncbi:hypothetical protein P175DRAFT_0436318 [Aspergillus ochraceoroseus IBT 24754]|uniref:Small ribosomal subunit protein mS38 n=3 Tax=Aspergillus subgen. Nidulantes TaxID=2720870 RepID=A0A0F8UFQ0_9EURO|nr:uncharacterized protein P175DRAFT_0436318 [Aspergillus ochraceoroseus IBT 24754]KKK15753.1 hypothetical protein AOCH_002812 [Aspergillus ochraceoroseus]KKK18383.1 hypothetical protein ARAM_001852 [Aspergillus rambellii]PTU21314.1 hypothetical protein P175DRAFT_0436318 [Aspergillus ochraceoroseus IBT 24754]